jgi:hypothetical protein
VQCAWRASPMGCASRWSARRTSNSLCRSLIREPNSMLSFPIDGHKLLIRPVKAPFALTARCAFPCDRRSRALAEGNHHAERGPAERAARNHGRHPVGAMPDPGEPWKLEPQHPRASISATHPTRVAGCSASSCGMLGRILSPRHPAATGAECPVMTDAVDKVAD